MPDKIVQLVLMLHYFKEMLFSIMNIRPGTA